MQWLRKAKEARCGCERQFKRRLSIDLVEQEAAARAKRIRRHTNGNEMINKSASDNAEDSEETPSESANEDSEETTSKSASNGVEDNDHKEANHKEDPELTPNKELENFTTNFT